MGTDFRFPGICKCFEGGRGKAAADESQDTQPPDQEQHLGEDPGLLEADAPPLLLGALGKGGFERPTADPVESYQDAGFQGLGHVGGRSNEGTTRLQGQLAARNESIGRLDHQRDKERMRRLEDQLASLQQENLRMRVSLEGQQAPVQHSISPTNIFRLNSDLVFAPSPSATTMGLPIATSRPWVAVYSSPRVTSAETWGEMQRVSADTDPGATSAGVPAPDPVSASTGETDASQAIHPSCKC